MDASALYSRLLDQALEIDLDEIFHLFGRQESYWNGGVMTG